MKQEKFDYLHSYLLASMKLGNFFFKSTSWEISSMKELMARLDEHVSVTRKRYNSVKVLQVEHRYEYTITVKKEVCKILGLVVKNFGIGSQHLN